MVDRWRVVNNLEIKKDNLVLKVRVSTIELSVCYEDDKYETMLFNDWSEVSLAGHFCERYKTKAEAMKNHIHIVDMITKGYFELEPTEYKIKIRGYE